MYLIMAFQEKLCFILPLPRYNMSSIYGSGERKAGDARFANCELHTLSVYIDAEIKILNQLNIDYMDISEYLPEPDPHLAGKKGDIKVTYGRMIISEGKKHQVKRTVRYCGAKVVYLKRLRISNLTLDEDLKKGEFIALTDDELKSL